MLLGICINFYVASLWPVWLECYCSECFVHAAAHLCADELYAISLYLHLCCVCVQPFRIFVGTNRAFIHQLRRLHSVAKMRRKTGQVNQNALRRWIPIYRSWTTVYLLSGFLFFTRRIKRWKFPMCNFIQNINIPSGICFFPILIRWNKTIYTHTNDRYFNQEVSPQRDDVWNVSIGYQNLFSPNKENHFIYCIFDFCELFM